MNAENTVIANWTKPDVFSVRFFVSGLHWQNYDRCHMFARNPRARVELCYGLNFILLTLHEMDAIFWREWELLLGITDPSVGLPIFVLAHIPLYGLLLHGLLRLDQRYGQLVSLIFGVALFAHFIAHAIVLGVTGTFMHSALSIGILAVSGVSGPLQVFLTRRIKPD